MKHPSRVAWGLSITGLLLVAGTYVLIGVGQPARAYPAWFLLGALATLTLLFGGLIWSRRPEERLGWILVLLGLVTAITLFTGEYATVAALGPQHWPFSEWTAWISSVFQVGTVVGLVVVMFLFPTGRPLTPRWRPVGWGLALGVVAALDTAVRGPKLDSNIDYIRNPLWVPHPPAVFVLADVVGQALFSAALIATIVQIVLRFRRSAGDQRQQMKWFAFAGVVAPVMVVVPTFALSEAMTGVLGAVVWTVAPLLLLGSIGVAVLRFRLYDIDVVINKTVVYFSLAAFITAVYVGIVVGLGALIGAGTSKPNLGLSILATAVVAVAFQPVRERIQKLANRLVYGKRATPYEVLSEFGHRMAGTYGAEDVLPRMARILAEGTGAKEARVWLGPSGHLTPVAVWPLANGDGHTPSADADLVVPVSHQGEELGALSITKAAGDRITPAEEKLITALASQAGLVLRNVKLIEDLKASRVRLVQAQDEERRKIERNIHDGAQQQLVALNVKLGLARRLTGDHAKLDPILTQLQEETNQALSDLRDLARGIYPPLLADQGLAAALEAQARRAAIPASVTAEGIGRFPQDVEAAVYFCTLEALQNVAKYAGATQTTVTLSAADGHLAFTVTDDGAGFETSTTSYGTGLQGMADRLQALGGEIEVRSQPGHGTTVTGWVPVAAVEPVG